MSTISDCDYLLCNIDRVAQWCNTNNLVFNASKYILVLLKLFQLNKITVDSEIPKNELTLWIYVSIFNFEWLRQNHCISLFSTLWICHVCSRNFRNIIILITLHFSFVDINFKIRQLSLLLGFICFIQTMSVKENGVYLRIDILH